MKALLMHRDRDFGPKEDPLPNVADLTQDLELDTLLRAMAAGDDFLLEVAKTAVLASLHKPEEILYRQHILADCQEQSDIVRRIYAIAVEAIERERKVWGWVSDKYPEGTLHRFRSSWTCSRGYGTLPMSTVGNFVPKASGGYSICSPRNLMTSTCASSRTIWNGLRFATAR
jgi:hypothetical protein